MSLTLGKKTADSITFLVGGTGSGSVGSVCRLYGQPWLVSAAVWGDMPASGLGRTLIHQAIPVEWPGGFPLDTIGADSQPRREGLDNLRRECRAARGLTSRIAIVAFSHGAWAAMRMMDEMLKAAGWRGHDLRLVTVSAPPLKENRAVAKRLSQHVTAGRLKWVGAAEIHDPVVCGWAGVMESLWSPAGASPAFGGESRFLRLDLGLSGLSAHDTCPTRWETWSHIKDAFTGDTDGNPV